MTHSDNININGNLEVSHFLPFFIFKVNEDLLLDTNGDRKDCFVW